MEILYILFGIVIGFVGGSMAGRLITLQQKAEHVAELAQIHAKIEEAERSMKAYQQATAMYMEQEIKNGIARATHE